MEAADMELLSDDDLLLIHWATGHQAVALRWTGETNEAARLHAWVGVAEAELARRGIASASSTIDVAA